MHSQVTQPDGTMSIESTAACPGPLAAQHDGATGPFVLRLSPTPRP